MSKAAESEAGVGGKGDVSPHVGVAGDGGASTGDPQVRRMMINVVIISLSFTLLFTAYQGTANLQSSLNIDAGLGTASLSTVYVALILSCIFVPTLMISKLTVKWTMALSMLGYGAYIAAQFGPSYYSLIPTAALVGLSAAPLWSAKCTYLTHVGTRRAEIESAGTTAVQHVTRLFGIFFLFFQCSQVFGNLISSTVLSSGVENPIYPNDTNLPICGATFCPWLFNSTASERPDDSKVNLLFGIYLGCAFAAALCIALFVEPLSKFGERVGSSSGLSGVQLLAATVRQLRDHRQLLLIPLTIFSGLEQGYLGADFTLSFVTCAYGVQNVGYVLITYGVCDALCSLGFGELVKLVGRMPIFTLGAALNLGLVAAMFTWKPTPEEPVVFFVLAGLWGAADAVWQTQINALYGNLFPQQEEAAFSNYRLWESLGFTMAYTYSTLICVHHKLWILVSFLFVGMAGYYAVELLEKKCNKKISE